MKIGLIGAGRMGFTLGKHFALYAVTHAESVCVMGYYSQHAESARQAAQFTDTKYYEKIEDLVDSCDTIFLTVPDGQIRTVFETIKNGKVCLEGKTLIHTSGALSSQVFSGMTDHINGYSIHPIYAVNSKTESYKYFQNCYMTIEGFGSNKEELAALLKAMGHTVRTISAEQKAKYHASAVFASNLVIGLYKMGTGLLAECGFTEEEAQAALMPLFKNNAENMEQSGCEKALTGPVSRDDIQTVQTHLQALSGDAKKVYCLLSKQLCRDSQTEIKSILETDDL